VDITFTLSAIFPWLSQSIKMGLRTEFLINHLYNLRELREKQAAERIKKGVVGRSGRSNPMMPSAKEMNPRSKNRARFNIFSRQTDLSAKPKTTPW
jgi:hypothetical protein